LYSNLLVSLFILCHAEASTAIYTLSLHDALPIFAVFDKLLNVCLRKLFDFQRRHPPSPLVRRDNPPEGVVRANALPQQRQLDLSRGVNAVESSCRKTHSDLNEVVVRRLLDRLDVSTVFFPNDGRRLDVCEVVLWIAGLVGPNVSLVFARQSLDRPHLDEVLMRRPRVGLDMDAVLFFDLLLCE